MDVERLKEVLGVAFAIQSKRKVSYWTIDSIIAYDFHNLIELPARYTVVRLVTAERDSNQLTKQK